MNPSSTVPVSGCAEREPYALRVLGDSMMPEFHDGAVVIVDPGGTIADGAFVIAEHDGAPILRQLTIDEDRYRLKPLNAGYPTLDLEDRGAIRGVVIQRAGRRRRDHKHYT